MDTDACIYNFDIRLEDILIKDKHFYASPDNKIWPSPFNAGIFLVLNTEIGLKIMDNWLTTFDKNTWKKEQDNTWIASCKWATKCYEQGSFIKNILPKYREYIHIFHWRFFNSFYSNLHENNSCVFILHFAGKFKNQIPFFLKDKSKHKKCSFLKTRKKN